MILSFNWLKEFLPELKKSPDDVAALLTRHSFETTVQKKIAIDPAIQVVRVIALEPHPNADRLQLVTVETGEGTVRVVCGATNMKVGDLVPYAPPGAHVQNEEGATIPVAEATIRGIKSPGMLNSLRELGLASLHSGLFVLPPDTLVGSPLNTHITNDVLLEADITPNRAHDALSHRGVAQEIARLLNLPLQEPETIDVTTVPVLEGWTFTAPTQVPQYLGASLTNVALGASPLWIQTRLLAVGMRPINNVVDITNYVMLESGNPMHAFDAQALPGHALGARFARDNERMVTLDGEERLVTPEVLLITSNDIPIAIAGVMGGAASQINDTTTTLLLEAATFDSSAISRATQSLGLTTESSQRFIKGLPQTLAAAAFARALYLLQAHAGATLEGMLKLHIQPVTPTVISFDPTAVTRLSGITWEATEAARALEVIGATIVQEDALQWRVTVPAERLDLTGEHDLVEEVIRINGIEKIPARTAMPTDTEVAPLPDQVRLREYIREYLVQRGFTETYNYSFEDTVTAQALHLLDKEALELSNPIAPEYSHLRTSLLPGLLRQLAGNRDELKKPFSRQEKALFEVGKVYRQGNGGQVAGVIEEEHVAGVSVALSESDTLLKELLEALGVRELHTTDNTITIGERVVGNLYAINARQHTFLKKMPPQIVGFALNLTLLQKADVLPPHDWEPAVPPLTGLYRAPSKFPTVFRDISVLVDPAITVEQVENIIERVGGELVTEVELFDVYDAAADRTATTETPQKSLSFHVSFQAPDRTLTTEEVATRHNAIVAALYEELSAESRE